MENPFESGHIKNYILAYSSIVVIMILFFIASTLFNEIDEVEKKIFSTEIIVDKSKINPHAKSKEDKNTTSVFKLLDTSY